MHDQTLFNRTTKRPAKKDFATKTDASWEHSTEPSLKNSFQLNTRDKSTGASGAHKTQKSRPAVRLTSLARLSSETGVFGTGLEKRGERENRKEKRLETYHDHDNNTTQQRVACCLKASARGFCSCDRCGIEDLGTKMCRHRTQQSLPRSPRLLDTHPPSPHRARHATPCDRPPPVGGNKCGPL